MEVADHGVVKLGSVGLTSVSAVLKGMPALLPLATWHGACRYGTICGCKLSLIPASNDIDQESG